MGKSSPKPVKQVTHDIAGFFPAIELWADEDPRTLEGLQSALLADMAPGTPYQHALANNLVELEWDKLRHRRMRDALLRAEVRDSALRLLATELNILGPALDSPEREAAEDVVSADIERRQAAEEGLREAGSSTTELIAKAYQKLAGDMDHHNRQIADAETRIRRLRQDYDLLKSKQAVLIEDAVLEEDR